MRLSASGDIRGFPGGTAGKESTCQCRVFKRCRLIPGLGRSIYVKEMATHCRILGQKSLAGYRPWRHKELDMTQVT